MLNAVLSVNDVQPQQVVEILEREGRKISGTYVVLGLAFKPGTDDVRESASLKIVQMLMERGAKVIAHDPLAAESFKRALGVVASSVQFTTDWRKSVREADTVIVATRWDEYKELRSIDLAGKIIFDARRMFSASEFKNAKYFAIGRRLLAAKG